jgi:hypothetical protein
MRRLSRKALAITLALLLWPLAASAQSLFTGLVSDESGAALPGVTVEASSPALIEKVKTVVTDGAGRYTIVDLRPGTYKLTFSLAGFSTAIRDALEITANFTATINVELKVGSLEESITVSGETPVVDTQQVSRTVTLGRDLLDSLPTTRSISSIGGLIPGIRLSTPDVGGERVLEASANRSRGLGDNAQTMLIDGMSVTASAGGQMPYTNDQMDAELSVRTTAIPASISSGGVNLNSIPRDGGNIFAGNAFLGGFTNKWQSDNVTPEEQARGLTIGNKMAHIRNLSAAVGGPVVRDRAWFFLSVRHADADEFVADTPRYVTLTAKELDRTFVDYCSAGVCGPFSLKAGQEQRTQLASYVRDVVLRLNTQVTPKNKLVGFLGRSFKNKTNEYGFGTDPVFASNIRDNRRGPYAYGYIKATSTVSNKVLVEAGWSTGIFSNPASQKPFNNLPRYLDNGQVNPAWIANARRQDSALNINPYCTIPTGCTVWWTGGTQAHAINSRSPWMGSVSYVTGSHNVKAGFTYTRGVDRFDNDRQADLIQVYNSGSPQSVTVAGTPMNTKDLVFESGWYLQDTWTIKRLTVNPGIRFEYYHAQMEAISMPAGRFVPARFFPQEKNIPNWKNDPAPRFSAAYDLFGNGRTVLKASFSKYYQDTGRSEFVRNHASAALVTESRSWFDVDLVPGTATRSGIAKPTDNDGIAEDNEIGPSSTTAFGVRNPTQWDRNIKREFNREITVGASHELMRGVAVSVGYYHRTFHDLISSQNLSITDADYTPFQVKIPSVANDATLAGVLDPNETITVYNLQPSKLSLSSDVIDRNSSKNKLFYNAVETSFSARIPGGLTAYGGWTVEQYYAKYCEGITPNGSPLTTDYGRVVSVGGRFCDQAASGPIPFQSDFKLAGSIPVSWGLAVGVILQNYPGTERVITWSPAASVFPNGQRTQTQTIILSKPGSIYNPRYNQIDFNIKKNFRFNKTVLTGQVDVFNATNSSTILTTTDTVGSSLGRISSILKGRVVRLVFQFKF